MSEEIFEPYEKLIEIEVLGRRIMVPENNSILRGMQFVEMESVSYGDLCWNGECLNCRVVLKDGEGKEKTVIACRTDAEPGMTVVSVSDEIAEALGENFSTSGSSDLRRSTTP
jgi:predicted molibdopterin-dependent oxidoreductase YjgC